MKKILITGIAGFVAKHFVEYLQKNNLEYEVLGLDILDDYEINYQYAKYKKIDLTDRALIQEVLDNFKPDYILHLASVSSVSVSWQKPVQSFVNNTNIFLNIVESIRELGLKTTCRQNAAQRKLRTVSVQPVCRRKSKPRNAIKALCQQLQC